MLVQPTLEQKSKSGTTYQLLYTVGRVLIG